MRLPFPIRYTRCDAGAFVFGVYGLLLALGGAAGLAVAAPVAGLSPSERPAGAPVIRKPIASPERAARLTEGVDRPLPRGLEFLKDQGAWYTPFGHPGMAAPYDLRQLRASPASAGPRSE